MAKPIFALIDCNNFFVSCERLFRPDLINKPVVVLSSNDGCVVSRSNEAKALGIPMAAPAFKYRQVFKEQAVVSFSANFELYGDISNRIINYLSQVTPRTEVYSVDESFLELNELNIANYSAWATGLKQQLLTAIGIPVAIGIAPTKTLAKLAAERAKRDLSKHDVLDLASLGQLQRETYLAETPVNEVWGVGRRLSPRLRAEGVNNALDLAHMQPRYAAQLMGVHGRQMVTELNGQACYPLETFGKVRRSIMHGRVFGEDTSQFMVIEAAIASLVSKACISLRREGLLARGAMIRLGTNRHKPGYRQISRYVHFKTPTADTGLISSQLASIIQTDFNPRLSYHRADVMLPDLISEQRLQADLFDILDTGSTDGALRFKVFDDINNRYGRQTIRLAAEDLSDAWQPKRGHRSPNYTSSWQELPIARIL